jgi:hypothetical protein
MYGVAAVRFDHGRRRSPRLEIPMLFTLCADFDPTDLDTDPILPSEAREPIDPDADWETLEELIAPSIEGWDFLADEDCDDVIADLGAL